MLISESRMVSITPDVEFHIRSNTQWPKLPPSVKAVSRDLNIFCGSNVCTKNYVNFVVQSLGNAPGLYEKAVVDFSIKNQLRWRNNLGM